MNEHLPPATDRLPGEAEITRLYRALPQAEPAPELDAAIRAAARRDLRARPPHWLPGLGAAAAVLLAAGLAWRIGGVRPPAPEAATPAASDAPAATMRAAPDAAPNAAARTAPETAAAPAEIVEEEVMTMAVPAPPPAMAPARVRQDTGASLQARAHADARAPESSADPAAAELREIRALLAAGQRDAAARALVALRARHPDQSVPEDLLPLLESR